jgi:hypothetical protein
MRKPPDVRLRFSTTLEEDLYRELVDEAETLQRDHVIRDFFLSRYEPETRRFGGKKSMDLVHAYFDVDTAMWVELDQSYQHGIDILRPERIVPAVLHDLFGRTMRGQGEAGVVWEQLRDLRPLPPGASVAHCGWPSLERLRGAAQIDASSLRLLGHYIDANAALSNGLTATSMQRGRLVQVLAEVGVFTFHRHGFDGNRSAALIEASIRSLAEMRK